MTTEVVTNLVLDAGGMERGAAVYTRSLDGVQAALEKVIAGTDALGNKVNSAGQTITTGARASLGAVDGLIRGMDAAYATSRQLEDGQQRLARAMEQVHAAHDAGKISADAAAARLDVLIDGSRRLMAIQTELSGGSVSFAQAQQQITEVFTAGARAVSDQRKTYDDLAIAMREAAAERARFLEMGDSALMEVVGRQKGANGAFVAGQYQQHYNSQLGVGAGVAGAAAEAAATFEQAYAAADRFVAMTDPAATAERAFAAAVDEARQLLDAGLVTQEQYTRGITRMREELDKARLAASPVASAQAALFGEYQAGLMDAVSQQKTANGAFVAGQYQQHYNRMLGVGGATGGMAAQSASVFAEGEANADRYLAMLDEQYAAMQKLKAAQDDLRSAIIGLEAVEQREGTSTEDNLRRRQLLTEKLAEVTQAHQGVSAGTLSAAKGLETLKDLSVGAGEGMSGLAKSMARMEAVHVGRATFDSLAAGIPVTQTLAMESGRVIQVLTEIPGAIAAVGVGAAIVAPFALALIAAKQVDDAFRETQRILGLTGGYLGVTAGQFQAMADAAAASGGISRSSALAIAQGYAATGQIGGQVLQGLTAATSGWAKATGTSADEARKSLAQMFADPTQGAMELAKTTHQIGLDEINHISALQSTGDIYAAQAELLRQIQAILNGISKTKGPDWLERVLGINVDNIGTNLSNMFTKVGEMFGTPDLNHKLETAFQEQKDAHDNLNYFRSQVGPNPTGLNGDMLKRYQEIADATDTRVGDLLRQMGAENQAAQAAQKKAAANSLGLQARPLVNAGVGWDQQQVMDSLTLIKQARDAHAITQDQYDSAAQRLNAQLAGIQTPYQRFQDQQAIERRVMAAPVGERAALRARLTAENAAPTWDVTGDQRQAMINGAETDVIIRQTAAYRDHAQAMQMDAAARARIAQAYGNGTAAGIRQEVVEGVTRDAVADPYGVGAHQGQEVRNRLDYRAASSAADLARQIADLRQRNQDAAALVGSGAAASKDTAAIQARTMAQKALNDAIAAGNPALQAQITAMQTQAEGLLRETEVRAAQVKLTQALTDLQAQNTGMDQQTQAIGLDAQQRAVLNARLAEEKRLRQELGALYDNPALKPQVDALINQAGVNAGSKQRMQQYKAEQQEFQTFAQGGIDALDRGLEGFMLRGQSAATTFKNIWADAFDSIMQEMIKLAVVNPLKNMMGLGGGASAGAGGLPTLMGSSISGAGTSGIGGIGGGSMLGAIGKGIADYLTGDGAGAYAPNWGAMTPQTGGDLAFNEALNKPFLNPTMGGVGGDVGLAFQMPAFAGGGQVAGPGTGTSDSIPARLSNGEFVVKAQAAAQHLDLLHAINDNRVQRFADGGSVGRPVYRETPAPVASAPASGPSAVNVSVHNYAGPDTQVEARPKANGDGIDLMLTNKTRGDINGGRMDRVMQANYGTQRLPNSRI